MEPVSPPDPSTQIHSLEFLFILGRKFQALHPAMPIFSEIRFKLSEPSLVQTLLSVAL